MPVFFSILGKNHDLGTAAHLQSRVDELQQPFHLHPARTHAPPAALCKGTGRKVNTWLSTQLILHVYRSQYCAMEKENIHWTLTDRKRNFYVFLPRNNFSVASSRNQPLKGTSPACRAQISALCSWCLRLSRICIKFSVLSDNITENQNKSDDTVPIISCYSEVNLDFPS